MEVEEEEDKVVVVEAAVEVMEEMYRIFRFRHQVLGTRSPPLRMTAIVQEVGEEEDREQVAGTVDHQVVSYIFCSLISKELNKTLILDYIFSG